MPTFKTFCKSTAISIALLIIFNASTSMAQLFTPEYCERYSSGRLFNRYCNSPFFESYWAPYWERLHNPQIQDGMNQSAQVPKYGGEGIFGLISEMINMANSALEKNSCSVAQRNLDMARTLVSSHEKQLQKNGQLEPAQSMIQSTWVYGSDRCWGVDDQQKAARFIALSRLAAERAATGACAEADAIRNEIQKADLAHLIIDRAILINAMHEINPNVIAAENACKAR